jgi:hypothetical protein
MRTLALIANGLLPIPSAPKTKRLEGPSAAEVFRQLMSLDLYRYAVQALNFFPGKPLLALLPRHHHPRRPRHGTIPARALIKNPDAKTTAAIAMRTPKLQIGLCSPSTHRPVGMLPTASVTALGGPNRRLRISLRSFESVAVWHPVVAHDDVKLRKAQSR